MFTGIVSEVGEVLAVDLRGEALARVKIASRYDVGTIAQGASIACAGICLTVVGTGQDAERGWFAVDVAAETMEVTAAARWREGTRLNLERALKVGDELGGHIVTGHVDGLAEVFAREELGDMARIVFRAPAPLARFIAPKGSVAIDGVSLTVNAVAQDTFSVLIIPHTLAVTTLAGLRRGDSAHLEVDLMARYAARLLGSK